MKQELEIYYNREKIFDLELERLNRADISKKNKEIITKFHNFLFASGSKNLRVTKLSSQLRYIAKWVNKDFDKVNEQDLENLVAYLNRKTDISEITKSDYRRIIRQFYKWLLGEDTKLISHVKVGNPKSKIIRFEDIISEDDLKLILEKGCFSVKQRAFISLLHESGARIAEFLGMRIRDIIKEDKFARIRLYGKTGERWIAVVSSIPYLYQYLSYHKNKDDLTSYLWAPDSRKYNGNPIHYAGANKIVKGCFERAGLLNKKQNVHHFRHSRATILASHLTEVQLCLYMGWEIGSKQVRTYVHASGKEVDKAVLSMHHIVKKEDTKPKDSPKECSICHKINASIDDFCARCGHALSVKTAIETSEKIKDETNKTFQLLLEISKDKELMKQFEDFVKKKQQEVR